MAAARWPAFTGKIRLWPLRNGGGLRIEAQVLSPAHSRKPVWIVPDRRHLNRLRTIRTAMNMAPII